MKYACKLLFRMMITNIVLILETNWKAITRKPIANHIELRVELSRTFCVENCIIFREKLRLLIYLWLSENMIETNSMWNEHWLVQYIIVFSVYFFLHFYYKFGINECLRINDGLSFFFLHNFFSIFSRINVKCSHQFRRNADF